MKSILVTYQSKTGFTKRYAEWIAQALDADLLEGAAAEKADLSGYRAVVYGGGFYAGKIRGLADWKTRMRAAPETRLVVFATGATPASAEQLVKETMDGNFTAEEQEQIPSFYFQSGLNYGAMGLADKLLMKAFCAMLGKKQNKTPDEAGMAEAVKSSFDQTDQKAIEPLVSCVRAFQ